MTEAERERLRAIFGSDDPLADLLLERERRIRLCAYFKAQRRGFAPGRALDDWLEAEREIDEALRPR